MWALSRICIQRQTNVVLIDKKVVSRKKRQLQQELDSKSLSSNDVIVCRACDSSDVFSENARKNNGEMPHTAGGNFLWAIPIPKEADSDPRLLRQTVESLKYFDTNKVPLKPFLCGRVARITSLASIAAQVIYGGLEQLCMIPMASFVQTIPMDVALIFRFNKQYWGVLHNFPRLNMESALLQSIVAND